MAKWMGWNRIKKIINYDENDCTVVIPYYNRRASIEHAVISVISLPYVAEVIIVNDNSPDDFGISIFSKNIDVKKITIIENSLIKGAQGARVWGVKASKTDFIIFLDSDDRINEYGMNMLHRYAKLNKEIALFYGNVSMNGKLKKHPALHGHCFPFILRNLSLVPFSGLLIRKSRVPWDNLDLTLPAWQDDDFILTVSEGNQISYIDVTTSIMELSSNSISLSKSNQIVGLSMLLVKWRPSIIEVFGFGRLLLWRLRLFVIIELLIIEDIKASTKEGKISVFMSKTLVFILKLIIWGSRLLLKPFFNYIRGW